MKTVFILLLTVMMASMCSRVTAQQLSDSKFPLFNTAEAAQHHCPFDSIVWLDTKTDTYTINLPASPTNSHEGAFICQRDADQMDYRLVPKGQ